MATFTPAFSAVISDDGTTITFTDGSNWTDNTQGYDISDFVRSIVMTDAFDEDIDTVEFEGVSLTATYVLNANKWVKAEFVIAGTPDYSLTQQYPFYRLFQLSYMEAIKTDCGCGKRVKHLCEVDAFLHAAEFAIPIGNGVGFQNDIDAANAYLNV